MPVERIEEIRETARDLIAQAADLRRQLGQVDADLLRTYRLLHAEVGREAASAYDHRWADRELDWPFDHMRAARDLIEDDPLLYPPRADGGRIRFT